MTREQKNNRQLYLLGDVHGRFDDLNMYILKTPKLKNCDVIVCGDFGVGFRSDDEKKSLRALDTTLMGRFINFYVIRGNHDDPSLFVHEDERNPDYVFDNIDLCADNTILQLMVDNTTQQTFYLVGGGISIDRKVRKPGRTYWENEIVPPMDEKTKEFIENNRPETGYDALICHVAPSESRKHIFPKEKDGSFIDAFGLWMKDDKLSEDIKKEYETIEKYMEYIKPKLFYHGHYHKLTNYKLGDIEAVSLGAFDPDIKNMNKNFIRYRLPSRKKL